MINKNSTKEEVITEVRRYVYSLEYASQRLRDNEQVVLAAASHNWDALEFASERLKHNKSIILKVAKKNNVRALKYVSTRLHNHKQIVMQLMNDITEMKAIVDDFKVINMRNNKQ